MVKGAFSSLLQSASDAFRCKLTEELGLFEQEHKSKRVHLDAGVEAGDLYMSPPQLKLGVNHSLSNGKQKVVESGQTEVVNSLLKKSVLSGIEKRLTAPALDARKERREERKAQAKDTIGKKWFDLPATEVTPELKQDLKALKLRAFYDPKRFYKSNESKELPKYFHVGRVIEGTGEFFSARLTNKERKNRLVDELLEDDKVRQYTKRKFTQIQAKKQSGGKNFYKKKQNKRKDKWQKSRD
eukprot:GILK01005563.1.p1 GENE.GILK01005563.1~~GILK01005563.1.p1  ORF type:complete len:241 (+),score=51.03 GILK01005563.1:42-764(+)